MKTTYKELTPIEALKRLAEAGKPIELYFRDFSDYAWGLGLLCGVVLNSRQPFMAVRLKDYGLSGATITWKNCAEKVEVKEVWKPWTLETAPKGCVLVRANNDFNCYLVLGWGSSSLLIEGSFYDYEILTGWEHSLDGGKTWSRCGTLE